MTGFVCEPVAPRPASPVNAMMASLVRLAKQSRLLRFNTNNRDAWIRRCAAAIPAGARVLDVGAGTCPYRAVFGHTEYKTHDFAKLDESQNRDGKAYGPIDYVSDILNIPVPTGSFDAVLCTEVLEHVPDPEGVIRECARVLRPGGTLLVTAPLGSGIHQEPFHFFGGFTPYWYRAVLPEAGFEIEELNANGDSFQHYGQFGQYLVQRIAPWNLPAASAIVLFPVFLVLLPLLGVMVPVLSHVAAKLVQDDRFTVGYLVRARRSNAPGGAQPA